MFTNPAPAASVSIYLSDDNHAALDSLAVTHDAARFLRESCVMIHGGHDGGPVETGLRLTPSHAADYLDLLAGEIYPEGATPELAELLTALRGSFA